MIATTIETALTFVAASLATQPDPWWIIGSAAARLAGAEGIVVRDVDVLTTSAAVAYLRVEWLASVQPRAASTSPKFRSDLLRTAAHEHLRDRTGMEIEVMGGLQLFEDGAWVEVVPRTRVAHANRRRTVFAPSTAEQMEILRRFGRTKDLARADALDRVIRRRAREVSAGDRHRSS